MLKILLCHPTGSKKLERGDCTTLGKLTQAEGNREIINALLGDLPGNYTIETMQLQSIDFYYNLKIGEEPLHNDSDITQITELFVLRETVCKNLHLNLGNPDDTERKIKTLMSHGVRKFGSITLSAHNPSGEKQSYNEFMHNLRNRLEFLCDKDIDHLMIDLDPNLFTTACGITIDIELYHFTNSILNFTKTESVTSTSKYLEYIFGSATKIKREENSDYIGYFSTIINKRALINQISDGSNIKEGKIQLTYQGMSALDRTLTSLNDNHCSEHTRYVILLDALKNAANWQYCRLDEEIEINAAKTKHDHDKNKWHLSGLKYLILCLIAVYAPHQKLFTFKNTILTKAIQILIVVIYYKLVSYKPKPEYQIMQQKFVKKITLKLKGEISAFPPRSEKTGQKTTELFQQKRCSEQTSTATKLTTKLKHA